MSGRVGIMRVFAGLLSAALLTLSGCAKEEPASGGGKSVSEGVPVEVMLNLSVGISGSCGAQTRSAGDVTVPGTAAESAVKSLTVFIVDISETGAQTSEACFSSFNLDWDGKGTGTFGPLTLSVTSGPKHIYVGANLTEHQIVSFAGLRSGGGVNSAYTAKTGTDYDNYDEMMSEFIESGGFTMMGKAVSGGSETIVVPDRSDAPMEISVELSRLVAKVLVTAETREKIAGDDPDPAIEYVNLDAGKDIAPSDESWLRLDDMHFMLNVANRKTFLYPKTGEYNGRNVVFDPNYRMESLIERTEDGVFQYRTEEHSRQFVRWVPHVWNTDREWGMMVMKHDEGRMPGGDGLDGSADIYNEGLYCLENTVGDIPAEWAGLPELADNENAVTFMAATYVLIAAKVTPRWIVRSLEEDPLLYPDGPGPYRAANEADARSFLPANTDGHDEHPEGTFYSPDRKTFYSYTGMMERIKNDEDLPEDDPDKLTRENFLCYPEGWGYYFSYVDGASYESERGSSLKFSSERSSVLRNHYYILHVRKVGFPSFPGDGGVNSMDVEVRRYGWTDAGSGDITLKP